MELSIPPNILVQLDHTLMLQTCSNKAIALHALRATTVWVVRQHPQHHALEDTIAPRVPRLLQSFLVLQVAILTKLETLEYRTVLSALLVIIAPKALLNQLHALEGLSPHQWELKIFLHAKRAMLVTTAPG